MSQLKDKLKEVPRKPGVYKFLGKDGEILYIGKAKSLRNRLSQYFGKSDNRPQLPYLMAEALDFDYIVVKNELESLFLESTLIREYLPPYNIQLRDDKGYAFIEVDSSVDIPQISYVRKTTTEKFKKYYGPYTSIRKIMQTLDLMRKVFHFCSNKEIGKRPCFYYFLHRCPGICIGQISKEEYAKHIANIQLFLSGKTHPVKKQLQKEMAIASKKKKFEQAAKLRDQFLAIATLEEKQLTIFAKNVSWDFVSLHTTELNACINLFKVREGKLRDKENFLFKNITNIPEQTRSAEIIQTFLEKYYADTTDFPKEIYLERKVENTKLVEQLIRSRLNKAVHIQVPNIGDKQKLIDLGKVNAEEYLVKWQQSQATNLDAIAETLQNLKLLLNLPNTPSRIECYDISNTQGTNPVGSMVVFKDGLPQKSEYRKFKITGKSTPDDFAMMREMLSRRLTRIETDKTRENKKEAWPTPDLIIIDGGKGQLGIAVEVLEEKKLHIPVVGLAKRIEEIFLPHNPVPIVLDHSNPVLQLIQRLRDEAHRFGITFHRSLRSKQAVKSALDTIPGIGPKTKKLLKQKIGTISQIKQASFDELIALVGRKKAEIIKNSL